MVDLRGLELRATQSYRTVQLTTAPFVGFELRAGCGTVRTMRVAIEVRALIDSAARETRRQNARVQCLLAGSAQI